jgi:hypothetical protein
VEREGNEEIIFELGLLLLDIVYLYESTSPKNAEKSGTGSNRPLNLSSSILFKSYLTFLSYTSCSLNDGLIKVKTECKTV